MLTQWWMRALLWLGLLGLGVSFSVPPRVLSRPRPVGADALFGFKARPPGASLTRRWSAAAVEGEELEGLRRQLSELDARIVERTNAKIALERELNELLDDRRRLNVRLNPVEMEFSKIVTETPWRSLVKACSWRFVAALITASTSLFFSGDLKVAASIVSSDFLTKAGTMYLGERVWNRVKWGKDDKEDKASRSVIKAFAWRGFALVNTLIISLVFSKSAKTAGKIASTDTVIKTTLYVLHERMWSKIDWGKSYEVEYNI